MSDTCTSQEEDGSPSTVDGLEKRPLGGDPIPQTHANVEKEIDPAIESEPQPATDSVTLQDCINKDQDEQRLTELRYANPHGTFITGMDVDSEEAALKRSQRAERFGLSMDEGVSEEESVEKRELRANRFGTKLVAYKGEAVKLVDELPDIPEGDLRPEVVHMHGTDELSTKDVFAYFQSYAPRNIEWINDSSCNAVWEDAESASRALRGLTRQPVALRSKFVDEAQPMETGSSEVREGREEAGESEAIDETKDGVNENSRGQGAVPWRLGVEHPKAKLLLLRIAVVGDHKVVGASKQSNYYRKYGNPNKMAAATWRKTSQKQELPTSDDGTQKTWREKQTVEDLRHRLGRRKRDEEGDTEESAESVNLQADPLSSLVKRPKPLHSERLIDDVEERVFMEDSERQRMAEGADISKADLRKQIQKKRRKRELKLRVGHNPRLVERTM